MTFVEGVMFKSLRAKGWLRHVVLYGTVNMLCQPSAGAQTLSKLIVESGESQTGSPGGFAPLPLIVTLKDGDGNLLIRQPIKFEAKEGQVQKSSVTAPNSTVVVKTDENGQAIVFYRLPDVPNMSCSVEATLGNGEQSQTVHFRIVSDDGSHKYASPFETPIHIDFNADASSTITWKNRLAGAVGFRILRSDNKGQTWKDIGTVPRDCKSCTVPPGVIQGMIGYSMFKVEPVLVGAEAQLIPINTPAPADDPVLIREKRFREAQQRRGLPTPALSVTY